MERDDNTEWTSFLTGEMLLFSLLGQVLYVEPDKKQLQSLFDEDVFSESPFGAEQPDVVRGLSLLQKWGQQARGDSDADSFKALKEDHLHLFIGVDWVLAPPWESVYFNEKRMLFQEQTLDVRKWYLEYGLIPEHVYKEPDDQIGLEMAFLSHLARLGLEALGRQDQHTLDEMLEAQREFASQHFLRWAPIWCDLAEKNAKTDFYRGLACLTRGAMAMHLQVEITMEVVPWM
jgi:TorA maturation chaperone TorD